MNFGREPPAQFGGCRTCRYAHQRVPGGPVVDGISLKVSAGQRLGVIGENGRGKTTLLRLLAGDLVPDQGTVTRHGSLSLVQQDMPFHDSETVGDLLSEALCESRQALSELDSACEPFDEQRYENALTHAEAIEAWDAERRADIALKALDADHPKSNRLKELSVGQRYRVRLACLLAERADVLLLDEPSSVRACGGTRSAQRKRPRPPGLPPVHWTEEAI